MALLAWWALGVPVRQLTSAAEELNSLARQLQELVEQYPL